jgi:ankyrin repeat protein
LRTRRRRILLVLVPAGLVVASAIGLAIWLWLPDASKLTGAAARGDLDGVRWCLRLGVDVNAPSRWGWHRESGQTPLTAAAQYGRVEAVRLLLESGADPNLRDFGSDHPQDTPLSTAARHGQLEACRVLLEAGADPNVPTHPEQPGEPGNWTALDWALQANQQAVADLLRQHGGRESGRRRGTGG